MDLRADLVRPLSHYDDRIQFLGLAGNERVLAAGSGIGPCTIALARHCFEVHGVERVVERLALTETLIRAHGLTNAHLTHGVLESLPFPDQFFSAVVCPDLPPRADPYRLLAELSRVTRPGGILHIAVQGPGRPLQFIRDEGLVRAGRAFAVDAVRGRRLRSLVLRRRRIEHAAQAAGLRIDALDSEGPPSDAPLPHAFTLAATRLAPTRARASTPAIAAPPPPEELRVRAQEFERRVAARPSGLTVVPVPGRSVPTQYRRRSIEEVRARLQGVDGHAWLDAIATRTTQGAASDQDAVERIIRLLQDSFFHDPIEQPPVELSPLELLLLGDGRCGHVASVAVDLLRRVGFPARIRQLPRHIVAEAFLDGDWRIVDPDAFKNGVIPTSRDGRLLSFHELERNPYQLDRFAPTGLWVRPQTRYTRNREGVEITGYVDSTPPEERGYPSSWYACWVPREHPPSLPGLEGAEVRGRAVRLVWSASEDRDDDLRGYRVRVGAASRGWSYDHAVYERLLVTTADDVASFETTETEGEIRAPGPGVFYWSVQAIDAHVEKEPETFYWSSDEASFTVD